MEKHSMILKSRKALAVLASFIVSLMLSCSSEMKEQFRTRHFVFFYNDSYDKVEAKGVGKALEANYARVSDDLNTKPVDPINVYLYTSRWAYATTHGHWNSSGNIEGDGKLHFLQHGRDEESINKIAIHEFTHAVMLKFLLDLESKPLNGPEFDKKFARFPVWLYEAIAVYEAREFVDPKTLQRFFAGNRSLSIDELNDRSKGQKIYQVGYTLIEYLLQKYGKASFLQLIANYGDLSVLHVTHEEFSKEWRDFVKTKYLAKK